MSAGGFSVSVPGVVVWSPGVSDGTSSAGAVCRVHGSVGTPSGRKLPVALLGQFSVSSIPVSKQYSALTSVVGLVNALYASPLCILDITFFHVVAAGFAPL